MKQNPNGISKTAYEWCIERELRVIGFAEKSMSISEEEFYTKYLTEEEFDTYLEKIKTWKAVTVKEGKLHLKSEKYLELRMYSLVLCCTECCT